MSRPRVPRSAPARVAAAALALAWTPLVAVPWAAAAPASAARGAGGLAEPGLPAVAVPRDGSGAAGATGAASTAGAAGAANDGGGVGVAGAARSAEGARPAGAGAPPQEPPAGPPRSPSRADYTISARLDGETKGIEGRLVLTWTNGTGAAAAELWFHLYLNAFANNRSTHMRESGGELRGKPIRDGWGWQRVTSILIGGDERIGTMRWRAPDDGNEEDRTVFSVVPPAPVGPGETVEVAIEWSSQLPRVRRRTGYKDDFLFVAQWFPKLGVFEGERGWNCHQFHASSEFYADYGVYDVTLDLPVRYLGKVGGSGAIVGVPELQGDRVITRLVAPAPADQDYVDATGKRPLVHDFAWTADPRYRVRQADFQYDHWRSRYPEEVAFARRALGPERDLRLRNVSVRLLMQPEHEDQWRRHFEATCVALFFYGLWFGEYPYGNITVVDPAWGAGAAGGMEYPTLFTAGTRMFTRPEMHTPEGVTVHECGHQFWYGLVGNNEFEAAWLDEGFNSFSDSEALWRHYGARVSTTSYSGYPLAGVPPAPAPGGGPLADAVSARAIPLPWMGFDLRPLRDSDLFGFWRDQPLLTLVPERTDPRWHDRVRYLSDPQRDPVDTFSYLYADRHSYSTNSYPRTAVVLRSLPAVVGWEAFLRGMRHYSETWRYRHPYPDDFFRAFQEGAGLDVSWYFDELFRGTGTVDWRVEVEQRRQAPPRGAFQADPPAGEFAQLEALEDEDLAAEEEEDEELQSDRPWHAEVLVVRSGELRLPLLIELRFDDGSSERREWTREEQDGRRWLRLEHTGAKKLVAALLDPDRGYYLDLDMSDNRWYDETDPVAPARWAERVFNRYVHLLHWQSGIGG